MSFISKWLLRHCQKQPEPSPFVCFEEKKKEKKKICFHQHFHPAPAFLGAFEVNQSHSSKHFSLPAPSIHSLKIASDSFHGTAFVFTLCVLPYRNIKPCFTKGKKKKKNVPIKSTRRIQHMKGNLLKYMLHFISTCSKNNVLCCQRNLVGHSVRFLQGCDSFFEKSQALCHGMKKLSLNFSHAGSHCLRFCM